MSNQLRRGSAVKTILVLEDEPSLMKLLRHTLRDYRLIEAPTAEEALLLFIDNDYLVDLLVADLALPTKSGAQVALHFRSKIPDLPVILTSGYAGSSWKERDNADLRRLGDTSVAVLQKPFAGHKLLDVIGDLTGWPPVWKARIA
jgi:two-component system cell cycle sensor histidine kinase/response regulator CckA